MNVFSYELGMPVHDEQKMNVHEELTIHKEKGHECPCT